MTKSFFRTLKSELIYKFVFISRKAARLKIFEYIESAYKRFGIY
ncbi:IS3 family transposase [bacterium]|nr:IS3 family transposase [bacterium]